MSALPPLTLARVMDGLRQLPALPVVVLEVLETFEHEDVDVDALARKIAQDQAIAARVLRIANSSFYGLQTRVGTVQEAVVVLGFRAVRAMVMSVAATNSFPQHDCAGFNHAAFWRHCVGVGLCARALAVRARMNAELAFTAGLMHDIGRLVLVTCFPREYAATLAYRAQHDCATVIAERDVLGLDHALVGRTVAERWKFSQALREAIAGHHTPQEYTADSLAGLVHVADLTAHALGLSGEANELVAPMAEVAWHRLGIDWVQFKSALGEVEAAFEETCQSLLV